MKRQLIASAMAATLLTASSFATAQDFRLQLEHQYDDVYESLSGVIVVTDKYCDIQDYTKVTLHYYNNPADSDVGGFHDNFTYVVNEPVIVNPMTCPEGDSDAFGGGECVPETFEPYLEYQDVVKSCDVYGTARLRDTGTIPAVYNSRARYDATGERLLLTNIEVWKSLDDTGLVFPHVELVMESGKFVIDKIVGEEGVAYER